MSASNAGDPDVVTIVVGTSTTLSGWEDVRVTRSMEIFPSSFVLRVTERYPTDPTQIVINPSDPIKVMLGNDVVLTGYVDDYFAGISAHEHTIRITGRSTCMDMLDCSAGESPYQLNNTTLVKLATKLAQPYGVTVSAPDGDSATIPIINVTVTEPAFEILEHIARWANFILMDDTGGNLVICRVGDANAASGFEQGENVQEAAVTFSMQNRYTEIAATFLSNGFLLDMPPAPGAPSAFIPFALGTQAKDMSFSKRADGQPRFRRLIFVSEQNQNDATLARQRAQWEMARRIGRSQAVRLTCDSWRDQAGALWKPNTLAPVSLPALKLENVTWLISTVVFVRDERGTTAELTLMPKEAFEPEPENLLPFDAQISDALPEGGAGNYRPAAR